MEYETIVGGARHSPVVDRERTPSRRGRRSAGVLALVLGATAAHEPARAGPIFNGPVSYPVGTAARSVAVADFDGDGRPDLGVASSTGFNVLLGNPGGSFQTAVAYTAGSLPVSVAIGDLNNDGRPDAALANFSSNSVSVFLGGAGGAFTMAPTVAVNNGPQTVLIRDVTGDGKADLIVNSYYTGIVSIHPGNGSGTSFGSPTQVAMGAFSYSTAAADFNGDGRTDLVTGNNTSGDNISLSLGQAGGSFAAATAVASGGNSVKWVTAADVNGDGKSDVIAANSVSNTVGVLLGNGNGMFAAPVTYATGAFPRSIAAGDVTGDGLADLAVIEENATALSILAGSGDGTFGPRDPYALGIGTDPHFVTLADVNGDGRLDALAANSGAGTVTVLTSVPEPGAVVTIVAAVAALAGGRGRWRRDGRRSRRHVRRRESQPSLHGIACENNETRGRAADPVRVVGKPEVDGERNGNSLRVRGCFGWIGAVAVAGLSCAIHPARADIVYSGPFRYFAGTHAYAATTTWSEEFGAALIQDFSTDPLTGPGDAVAVSVAGGGASASIGPYSSVLGPGGFAGSASLSRSASLTNSTHQAFAEALAQEYIGFYSDAPATLTVAGTLTGGASVSFYRPFEPAIFEASTPGPFTFTANLVTGAFYRFDIEAVPHGYARVGTQGSGMDTGPVSAAQSGGYTYVASVPEPGALTALGWAAGLLLARRRKCPLPAVTRQVGPRPVAA